MYDDGDDTPIDLNRRCFRRRSTNPTNGSPCQDEQTGAGKTHIIASRPEKITNDQGETIVEFTGHLILCPKFWEASDLESVVEEPQALEGDSKSDEGMPPGKIEYVGTWPEHYREILVRGAHFNIYHH